MSWWWLVVAAALGVAAGLVWARAREGERPARDIGALDTLTDTELSRPEEPVVPRDALTGLRTRAAFEEALELAYHEATSARSGFAVLYLGLDAMRAINELHGHAAGDAVLAEVGRRLLSLNPEPSCARIASDEFALLVHGGAEQARQRARRAIELLSRPWRAGTQEVRLSVSVGIARYPEHGSRVQLVAHATAAMRSAKMAGGGAFAEYQLRMTEGLREKLELSRDLQRAVSGGQLELVYQPKVDARSQEITAAEALLRWNHPVHGVISPERFIPLAERSGLIASIGDWVLDEAIRQAAQWRDKGLRMRVAINVSGHQMRQDDFVERLARGLARHDLRPGRFTCEITETLAMEDTADTQRAFARLREVGVHVSIDDFGTGHSSLALLRRLPAAELKLDTDFASDLAASQDARTIVQAIVQMAHTLDLRVVAEGVETPEQRDLLVALGCDELQGFYFARPMSAAELELWAMHDDGPGEMRFRDSLFGETAPAGLN